MSAGGHGTRQVLYGRLACMSAVYGPEKWAPLSATKRAKRVAAAALERTADPNKDRWHCTIVLYILPE
jgi:hypothetical protein